MTFVIKYCFAENPAGFFHPANAPDYLLYISLFAYNPIHHELYDRKNGFAIGNQESDFDVPNWLMQIYRNGLRLTEIRVWGTFLTWRFLLGQEM